MKTILKAENIHKIYAAGTRAETHALRGVDLEIKEGEFVAIMGRSGSGKSTLLHQLALLDRPNKGKIWINDVDTDKLSDAERSEFRLSFIGYVFQDYALLPELNLIENVLLPLVAAGEKRRKAILQAKEAIESVGLSGLEEHLPSELSGGQKQRVSIARAIVNKPKILFADEPVANLDSVSSKQVLDTFLKLNKEYGQTVIMVTHEEEDKKIADRVVYMKDGRIVRGES